MKYRAFISSKNRKLSDSALEWCFDNIGSWEEGKWIRWTNDGDSIFKFLHEEDYSVFLLKFSEVCEKNY